MGAELMVDGETGIDTSPLIPLPGRGGEGWRSREIHHSLEFPGLFRGFANVSRVFERLTSGRISLSSRSHLGSISLKTGEISLSSRWISVPSRLRLGCGNGVAEYRRDWAERDQAQVTRGYQDLPPPTAAYRRLPSGFRGKRPRNGVLESCSGGYPRGRAHGAVFRVSA
jgi:hypothetical protein